MSEVLAIGVIGGMIVIVALIFAGCARLIE
jgi:hypothetical protein